MSCTPSGFFRAVLGEDVGVVVGLDFEDGVGVGVGVRESGELFSEEDDEGVDEGDENEGEDDGVRV